MFKVSKILFPTDVSDRVMGAVPYVRGLAERFGAEVHLLHNLDATLAPHFDPMAAAHDPGSEFAKAELEIDERLAAAARELEAGGRTRVEIGVLQRTKPAEAIAAYAENHAIDLVVLVTHATETLADRFLGRVPQDVVESCPSSVLTLTARRAAEEPRFARLLVPVNYSDSSKDALLAAGVLLEHSGELQIIHLLEDSSFPVLYGRYGHQETYYDFDQLNEGMRSQLTGFWNELSDGRGDVQVVAETIKERSARGVLRFAEDHASDLIVVETKRAHHVFRTMWQNVALHPGPCPVLTLRHA